MLPLLPREGDTDALSGDRETQGTASSSSVVAVPPLPLFGFASNPRLMRRLNPVIEDLSTSRVHSVRLRQYVKPFTPGREAFEEMGMEGFPTNLRSYSTLSSLTARTNAEKDREMEVLVTSRPHHAASLDRRRRATMRQSQQHPVVDSSREERDTDLAFFHSTYSLLTSRANTLKDTFKSGSTIQGAASEEAFARTLTTHRDSTISAEGVDGRPASTSGVGGQGRGRPPPKANTAAPPPGGGKQGRRKSTVPDAISTRLYKPPDFSVHTVINNKAIERKISKELNKYRHDQTEFQFLMERAKEYEEEREQRDRHGRPKQNFLSRNRREAVALTPEYKENHYKQKLAEWKERSARAQQKKQDLVEKRRQDVLRKHEQSLEQVRQLELRRKEEVERRKRGDYSNRYERPGEEDAAAREAGALLLASLSSGNMDGHEETPELDLEGADVEDDEIPLIPRGFSFVMSRRNSRDGAIGLTAEEELAISRTLSSIVSRSNTPPPGSSMGPPALQVPRRGDTSARRRSCTVSARSSASVSARGESLPTSGRVSPSPRLVFNIPDSARQDGLEEEVGSMDMVLELGCDSNRGSASVSGRSSVR